MQPPNGNNPFGPAPSPFGQPQQTYGQPPSQGSYGQPPGPAPNPFGAGPNPFGAPGPNLPAKPKKTSKLVVALAAVPALAVVACMTAYLIDSRGHENADVLDGVCAGQRSPRAAPYLPGALPHRLAWFERSGSDWSHRGGPPVPTGWSTLWADEAQLVVCAEAPVTQVIERCPFTNGRFVERRQVQQGIRLVVASTGQELTRQTVVGTIPQPCEAQMMFTRNGATTVERTGSQISDSVVAPLIEQFVTR